MKNIEVAEHARQAIGRVVAELNPDFVKSRFDEPIAKAAKQFEYEAECPVAHKVLHEIIARFVEHIYEKALESSWMIADPLAEAILLLDRHYHSVIYGAGYAAAVLDADDAAAGGIQTVLAGLAESIKDAEREKYIRGVFTWHLRSAQWSMRCEIARILLEDYGPFLPERLRKCAPAQLVDVIPSILQGFICSDSALQQISFCTKGPLTAETLLGREPL